MHNQTTGPSSTLNLESLRVTVPEIWPGQNCGKIVPEKKNNKANWMVSNSAKLDRRTKQHTHFGVSASNGSRDMGRTKSWQKKKIYIYNEVNWMVSNGAKLDCRTKQHTESGVSTSDGSRDMVRTRSQRKKKKKKKKKEKKKKKNELTESHKTSPTGIANNANVYKDEDKEILYRNIWEKIFEIPPEYNRNFNVNNENLVREFLKRNRELSTHYHYADLTRLDENNILIKPVRAIDIINIIKGFKNKALGISGINKQILSQLPPNVIERYSVLTNLTRSMGYYPTAYKNGELIFTPKQGKDTKAA